MTRPPFKRSPLPGACFPQNPGRPTTVADPCSMLPALRAAHMALIAGQQTAEIRDGERVMRFHAGDAKQLRAEIRRLEMTCPQSAANPHGGQVGAVRAGPYTNQPGVHPGLYPQNPRR